MEREWCERTPSARTTSGSWSLFSKRWLRSDDGCQIVFLGECGHHFVGTSGAHIRCAYENGLGLNPQSQPRRTFPQKRTLQTVTHFPPDDLRITHGNHPRSSRLRRIFQCLAVSRQPLKLETLEI